jgi:hypothetical protein
MKTLLAIPLMGLSLWFAFAEMAAADSNGSSAPGHTKPATDVSATSVGEIKSRDELRNFPLTIEMWVRLHNAAAINVLLSSDPKSSSKHWDLYTEADSGYLCAYLPGRKTTIKSITAICDDKWHYIAAHFGTTFVEILVDGVVVKQALYGPETGTPNPGSIGVGRTLAPEDGNLSCNGLIQDVRISKGTRDITAVPQKPFAWDDQTIEIWFLDGKPDAAQAPSTANGVATSPATPAPDPSRPNYLTNVDFKEGLSAWRGDPEIVFLKPDGTEGSESDEGAVAVLKLKLSPDGPKSIYQEFRARDNPGRFTFTVQIFPSADFQRNTSPESYTPELSNTGDGEFFEWATFGILPTDFWIMAGPATFRDDEPYSYYISANVVQKTWVTVSHTFGPLQKIDDRYIYFRVPRGSGVLYLKNPSVTQ